MPRGQIGEPVPAEEAIREITARLSRAGRVKVTVTRATKISLPKSLKGRPVRVYKSSTVYVVIAVEEGTGE